MGQNNNKIIIIIVIIIIIISHNHFESLNNSFTESIGWLCRCNPTHTPGAIAPGGVLSTRTGRSRTEGEGMAQPGAGHVAGLLKGSHHTHKGTLSVFHRICAPLSDI